MEAYRKAKRASKTTLRVNASTPGEPLHWKVERMLNNREPLTEDGVQPIYTERSLGVLPHLDIRTDRFDIAVEATTTLAKQQAAKSKGVVPTDKGEAAGDVTPEPKGDGKPE